MSIRTFPIWYVDAFTENLFGGNPAAVVALEDTWLPDEQLRAIAGEINLSETAFFLRGHDPIPLRWFTPLVEVPLCGHATLATAWVIRNELREANGEHIVFDTASGRLNISGSSGRFILDFPARPSVTSSMPLSTLTDVIGAPVVELFESVDRYVCVVANKDAVKRLAPDLSKIATLPLPGLVVTARDGDDAFVSRYFAPAKGVAEDPVTGTSHCTLAPFWGDRLNRNPILGRQLSARSGEILCRVERDRVFLEGKGRLFLKGHINVPVAGNAAIYEPPI
ncbi:PhzF family phenazine biosynthesis protein [Ensifer sp. YR511]|uniref:PhzF family phenazine biosynthesis protein n=1 Tax=Ensifer sp. YR511 TaxID=1855294 RepID=UPI000887F6EF|nr:PhzF family phenazine biosynthesis protein [Ensifer sp. YR511]SDN42079.1 phenazine biosynthesis protein PhzF family [Ensifer sp. YR511]